ncbi:hypothetical protein DVH05_017933 [Phytophthora capsici]|nr:hypothetical protein DVH05_017933 [Phytophthora capsici]
MGSLSCCTHESESGRKERILRGGMSIKLVSMVWNPVQIYLIENVELKKGRQLYMGVWLYAFEFISTLIDLSLNGREKESKGRWRVCLKNYADFMCAQMIAAQLFNLNEWHMWESSLVTSLIAMIYLDLKYAIDSVEYETRIVWTGLGVGIVEGLAFSEAQLKSQEEVLGYSILFILTMILPIITKKYQEMELPTEFVRLEYEHVGPIRLTPNQGWKTGAIAFWNNGFLGQPIHPKP